MVESIQDIKFNNLIRELIDEGVFAEESEVVESPTTEAHTSPTTSEQRLEYYTLVDKILRDSFTCERNRAIAEQLSRTFAPDNHRLRLECVHNIHDFTVYPENSEQFHRAKQWLQQHDLMGLLWRAYINQVH